MTTDDKARLTPRSAAGAQLRGAALPALGVSVGCVTTATWLEGSAGFWGSLVGASLVFAFFSTSLLVLGEMRTTEPVVVLLVALGLYTVKVVALAVVFVLLGSLGWLDDPLHRGALGLTVIVCTLTWTIMQIVSALRYRKPLYDLRTGS